MGKNREFLFWSEKGQEEKTEQMSLTKAVKSVQDKFVGEDKKMERFIGVEYLSKKGKNISTTIELPWGREKKLRR